MNLHSLKQRLADVLKDSGLSQLEFSEKHGLSYSWVNKFLNDVADNPRFNTLSELEAAIDKERHALELRAVLQ